MPEAERIDIIINIAVAVGTLLVAVLAIWGDWFKKIFASPKLSVRLRSQRGNPTKFSDGRNVIYYHLEIENKRNWALAKGVQVMISGAWKRIADGSYKAEVMAAEIPLTWAFPQFSPINPSIRDSKVCDFGFLIEGAEYFTPSTYFVPNNFPGYVGKGESVRYGIEIQAENFRSIEPYVVEVSWDGSWDKDLDAMERHLVVREVNESINPK